MSDTITVCPECNNSKIRVCSSARYGTDTPKYHCWGCGAHFDDPATREPRSTAPPGSDTVEMLLAADPEEVGP